MDRASAILEAASGPDAPVEHAEATPKIPPRVAVAQDGMSATLQLASECTESEVRAALKKAGVVYGLDGDAIESSLRALPSEESVVVARGTAVEQPLDGYVEYLFQAGQPRLVERAGRVNWHELNLLESVAAGTPLAVKHPAQPGKPGKTVRGVELKARLPRDCRLSLGPGAQLSEADPNTVVAAVAGVIRLDPNGKIAVDSTLVVDGDVDLSLGNLDVEGSVIVRGNVREGFTVKANGNVEVHGLVDKGCVIAGGSVKVKGPVFGTVGHPDSVEVASGHRQVSVAHDWPRPEATVQAGEDIVAQFADNAVLRAGRDVLLEQEALHCNIEAEGRVAVGGEEPLAGGIIGGFVRAGQDVSAFGFGSLGRSATRVRAGYDWLVPAKLGALDAELASAEARLAQVTDGLRALMELRSKAALNTAQRMAAEELRRGLPALQHAVRELKSQRKAWQDTAERRACVQVFGTARAGTEVTVDGIARVLEYDISRRRLAAEGESVQDVDLEQPAAVQATAGAQFHSQE